MVRTAALVLGLLFLSGCGGGGGRRGAGPAPIASSVTPTGGTWQARAPLPGGPRQETGVAALGSEVYVVGGFDATGAVVASVEVYDPAANTWRSAAPVPVPLHHANVAAQGGRLYVLGFLAGGSFLADGRAFGYDPVANAWTPRASMPAGTQRGASGTAELGGRIFVAGGFRGGGSVTDFSVYDPAADAWTALPALPAARDHLGAGAIGGSFFAVGGRNGPNTARLDAFDPATASWSARAPMPTARGGVAATVVNGRLLVFGGEGNPGAASGVFPQAESYDPATDAWTSFANMLTPRHGMGAATVGSVAVVPGGATSSGFFAVSTNEAFAPP